MPSILPQTPDAQAAEASQVLYRFWNLADELLYVGITAKPWERWKQHRGDKPWWSEVAKVTLETFATREDVRAAELEAIRNERPRYNIASRPKVKAEAESTWDGKHVPGIACIGDYLECSCRPPDWGNAPKAPDRAWLEENLFHPEDYAEHVIQSVAAEEWRAALDRAKADAERRSRRPSVKFVKDAWPAHMQTHCLPRSWQSYAREWLADGATRVEIREAMEVAADAFYADRTERPWLYAGGVIRRILSERGDA